MKRLPATEAAAGQAVAEGALIAGPLDKRSDFLRKWNSRFCVLTTEQLAWHVGLSDGQGPAPASGGSKDGSANTRDAVGGGAWRCVVITSGVALSVPGDGALTIKPSASRDVLSFRAGSHAEMESWHAQLQGLIETLQEEAKLARLHMREIATLFDTRAFSEHPHIGSRNLRQRSLCAQCLFSAPHLRPASSPARAALVPPLVMLPAPPRLSTTHVAGKCFYSCRLSNQKSTPKADALLAWMLLPQPAHHWGVDESRAFSEIVEAVRQAAHPFLIAPLHAEVMPAKQRAAAYRKVVPLGSLRDVMHNAANPRLPYSHKYGSSGNGGLPAAKVALYGRQVCASPTEAHPASRPTAPARAILRL